MADPRSVTATGPRQWSRSARWATVAATVGSVVGACLGALIFGVVQMGILFTGAPSDWFQVFLGAMLLIAVLFNSSIRRRVTGER